MLKHSPETKDTIIEGTVSSSLKKKRDEILKKRKEATKRKIMGLLLGATVALSGTTAVGYLAYRGPTKDPKLEEKARSHKEMVALQHTVEQSTDAYYKSINYPTGSTHFTSEQQRVFRSFYRILTQEPFQETMLRRKMHRAAAIYFSPTYDKGHYVQLEKGYDRLLEVWKRVYGAPYLHFLATANAESNFIDKDSPYARGYYQIKPELTAYIGASFDDLKDMERCHDAALGHMLMAFKEILVYVSMNKGAGLSLSPGAKYYQVAPLLGRMLDHPESLTDSDCRQIIEICSAASNMGVAGLLQSNSLPEETRYHVKKISTFIDALREKNKADLEKKEKIG